MSDNKTPYEEGRDAYLSGVSFFYNPYLDTSEAVSSMKEWARGWGDIQKSPFVELPTLVTAKMLEVFAYHDGPRLFACTTASNLNLVVWAEETKDTDTWVVAKITRELYTNVVTGEIDFKSAFKMAERAYLLRVIKGTGSWSTTDVKPSDLPDSYLPVEGERFCPDDESR